MKVNPGARIEDSWPKQIDTLTGASDHIQLLCDVMDRTALSKDRIVHLKQQMKVAQARITDKRLYLAVLGEFASGKSTFINALLRIRLLKAARMATTASATFLDHADTFSVLVTFSDGTEVYGCEQDYSNLVAAVRRWIPKFDHSATLNKTLNAFTSEQVVANHVTDIKVTISAGILKDNISIIDTPGIGAGADYANKHACVTDKIVNDKADAAIVLVPAFQPMSKTLVEFLDTKARHFLHRCIFVVTAMDACEENERPEVMEFVQQQLQTKLGIDKPSLVDAAAITMLPDSRPPTGRKVEWDGWRQKFEKLERYLIKEMVRRRAVIVSERLIRILREALSDLRNDVEEQQRILTEKYQTLRENSVPRIEEVLDSLIQTHNQLIKQEATKYSRKISDAASILRMNANAKARTVVGEIEFSNNKHIINEVIPQEVNKYGDEFFNLLRTSQSQIDTKAREAARHVNDVIAEHYRELHVDAEEIKLPKRANNKVKTTSETFQLAYDVIEQYEENVNNRGAGGAALGAILGSLIAPGVGTVIGLMAGGAVGEATCDDLDEHRKKILDKVLPAISVHVDKCVESAEQSLNATKKEVIDELQSVANAHLTRYSAIVNGMVEEHERKILVVQASSQQVETDSRLLEHACSQIEQAMERLTHI